MNDTSQWEHLLPGEPLHMRVLPEIGEEEQIDIRQQEKHLDMPDSWVEKLVLTDEGNIYYKIVIKFLENTTCSKIS